MNVLIIGNNPKHAKVFSMFADNVYILLQKQNKGITRTSKELYDYKVLYSNIIYGTIKYNLVQNNNIRKIIKKYSIDVVFSNRKDDMVQAKIATLMLKKKPILLVTFHNSTAWTSDVKAYLMEKLISMFCDGCICLARFMYDKLIRFGIDKDKLIFLPNTIEFENFNVKGDYHFKDGIIRICYTAVIYPLKNQEIIIEAINSLKHKYKFEVHLYGDFGDNEYYLRLKDLISNYGLEDIIFLDGRIDANIIRKILSQNDIYISSTTIEMSPYNILEAKAAALPVLASNVLGQKDLIDDGVDGILFDVKKQEDLISKLDLLISDIGLRQRIGRNARKSVTTIKSYMEAAKKLQKFVESLK